MNRLIVLVLLVSFALAALAQPAPVETSPQYWVAAGAGWNHYSTPQASGWVTFGAKVGESNYALTTVTMTSKSSTLRAGWARVMIRKDNFALLAIGEAGVASGEGNVGGAFSGGGSLAYDISKWTKVPASYTVATIVVFKSTLGEIQPVFCFGFGKAF